VSPTDLDEVAATLPLLSPPPLPVPGAGDEPLATRGHPGGPGFAEPSSDPADGSVWQRAQAIWLAADAQWSGATPAPGTTPTPGTPPLRPHWSRQTRRWTLVTLAVVLFVALAGYAWYSSGRLGPRTYPPAQAGQFTTSQAGQRPAAGTGLYQSLTQVASSGDTTVAVGQQAGGDITRAQFFVSTDPGRTWQLAPVHSATGGQPAPGHPAQFVTAGRDGWLAVGPHAIWTSPNGRSWTLASTAGITPADAGDQVRLLIRTATGYLAAGQNVAEGAGVIWTSPDGRHWHRSTAAQTMLPGHHGTIVAITGAAASGPDILLSGLYDPWYESAGPHLSATWLSTDGGSTWRSASVPVSNGATSGLTGLASTPAASTPAASTPGASTAGFVAVRPLANGQGGVVYTSADGSSWRYATTLTSNHGLEVTAVDGGPGGYSILGQGPGGQLWGFSSTDGTHWSQAVAFGAAPGTTTGSSLTAGGALIATGATGSATGQHPFLAVASPSQPPQAINVSAIAGATLSPGHPAAKAVAVSGRQQVVVGESGGTLATWSGPVGATTPLTPGTWATATGQPPAGPGTQGTQQLTSVVHGPAGWLATGNALTGATTRPVAVVSADGTSWLPATIPGPAGTPAAALQAAASPGAYVIVGRATTSAGTVPAAWWSGFLHTWTRASTPATPGQMLAVTATSDSFVAVGGQGIDPAVWTSADGRQWSAHPLPIPGTGARAQLSAVAASGRTVVAFGQETWATGHWSAFAEVSHDGGRTWTPVPFSTLRGGTVTAVTTMTGGFTATGSYGPAGDRDVAVWTSANGNGWLTQPLHGPGLSGPGVQQLTGLAATGTKLTGVGFTATPTTEQPTLWQVPAR